MKFVLILLAIVLVLAAGFFAGSCFIRGNSAPPASAPSSNASPCIAAAAEVAGMESILPLIRRYTNAPDSLSATERIRLRQTLLNANLPACSLLLEQLAPRATPTPTPDDDQQ